MRLSPSIVGSLTAKMSAATAIVLVDEGGGDVNASVVIDGKDGDDCDCEDAAAVVVVVGVIFVLFATGEKNCESGCGVVVVVIVVVVRTLIGSERAAAGAVGGRRRRSESALLNGRMCGSRCKVAAGRRSGCVVSPLRSAAA